MATKLVLAKQRQKCVISSQYLSLTRIMLGSAPSSSNVCTQSALPPPATIISGVVPSWKYVSIYKTISWLNRTGIHNYI